MAEFVPQTCPKHRCQPHPRPPQPLSQPGPRCPLSMDLGCLPHRTRAGARSRACRRAVPTSSCTPSRTEAASRAPPSSEYSCGAHIRRTMCPSSWWATRRTWHAAGKSPWKVSPPVRPTSPHSSQAPVTAPPPGLFISGLPAPRPMPKLPLLACVGKPGTIPASSLCPQTSPQIPSGTPPLSPHSLSSV